MHLVIHTSIAHGMCAILYSSYITCNVHLVSSAGKHKTSVPTAYGYDCCVSFLFVYLFVCCLLKLTFALFWLLSFRTAALSSPMPWWCRCTTVHPTCWGPWRQPTRYGTGLKGWPLWSGCSGGPLGAVNICSTIFPHPPENAIEIFLLASLVHPAQIYSLAGYLLSLGILVGSHDGHVTWWCRVTT